MYPNIQDVHDLIQWRWIFELLSMERIEPYLPSMGIPLINLEVMRDLARQYLEEDDAAQDFTEGRAVIHRTFDRIGEALGEETTRELAQWGTDESFTDRRGFRYEHYWTNILSRLAGVYEEAISHPPLSSETLRVIQEIVQDHLGNSYWMLREQLKEAEQAPQTEWEKRLYEQYNRETPDAPNPVTPWIHLLSLLRERALCQTLREIRLRLSRDEFENFFAWARREAQAMKADSLELPSCSK